LLIDLLTAPEAQAGWYEWLAVLVAHAFVGVALLAGFGALMSWLHGSGSNLALAMAIEAYAIWETMHYLINGDWRDALIDWTAVSAGAVVAWAAWNRRGAAIAVALVVLSVVGIKGVRTRR